MTLYVVVVVLAVVMLRLMLGGWGVGERQASCALHPTAAASEFRLMARWLVVTLMNKGMLLLLLAVPASVSGRHCVAAGTDGNQSESRSFLWMPGGPAKSGSLIASGLLAQLK